MRRARMRAAVLMLALAPWAAAAFPDRPVTIINPYATGSQTDAVARALADDGTVHDTPARGITVENATWFLDQDAASSL